MIWVPPKRQIVLPQRGRLPSRERGFLLNPYRFGAAGPTDPNFSNVITLLHMDGADASTTFTDNSASPQTWTASGNAQIDTADSKFGGASGLFDGSGDYVTANAAGLAIGTGDFTVECWFKANSVAGGYSAVYHINSGDIGIYRSGNNMLWYEGGNRCVSANVTTGVWYHIAATRQGTTIRLFLDGVKSASDYTSSTNYTTTTHRVGASIANAEYWNGWIDEVRVTKGVARYTANFTPPTAAFPNS